MNQVSKQAALLSNEAYGTTMLVILFDTFGSEFLSWETETIEMEIKRVFGALPSDDSLDRLYAAISMLTTNLFFISLEGFNTSCLTLNFKRIYSDTFIPANLEDIMWGITEAKLILGADADNDKNNEFSRDIRLYVGKVLEDAGILDPPTLLDFAELTKLGPDADLLADLPELGGLFEAEQADSKATIEHRTLQKVNDLLNQIGSLKLENSDLSEYKKMMVRFSK